MERVRRRLGAWCATSGRTSPAPWTGPVLVLAALAAVAVFLVAPWAPGPVPVADPEPATVAPAPPPPAVLRAAEASGCVLNVRAGPTSSAPLLATLNCTSTVRCAEPGPGPGVCAPVVRGEPYRCATTDGPTDDRWARVSWFSPKPTYVALSCAVSDPDQRG